MVGPDVEKTGLVRHSARMLVHLAAATVPKFTVILRKFYGMGGVLMGSKIFNPNLIIGWPTAEWGAMGMEGAASLIYRNELAAAPDEATRQRLLVEFTADLKRRSTGIEVAGKFEIDDIIDPVDTRRFLAQALATVPTPPLRQVRKHVVDPW
jgi:acetyl-CoA carboxylase carboxyltransferase component